MSLYMFVLVVFIQKKKKKMLQGNRETKSPWKYKRIMKSLFTDNTILYLCPEAVKWSKNVHSLEKSISLA